MHLTVVAMTARHFIPCLCSLGCALVACAESPPPGPLPDEEPTAPFGSLDPSPPPPPEPAPATKPPLDEPAAAKPPAQDTAEPACPTEVEDNGSIAKANDITTCVSGTMAWGDNDYFRIAAPKDATRMLISHKGRNGRVEYRVTEDGGPIVGGLDVKFTDYAPDIEVAGAKSYIIQVSSRTREAARPAGTSSRSRSSDGRHGALAQAREDA
jgi:hypothetical protein